MDNQLKRLGVILPPGNVAVEREYALYCPDEVAINYNRLSRPVSVSSKDSLLSMVDSLERTAVDLAQTHPDLIVFACTSGSFLEGQGLEDNLARLITQYTGIPAITTSMAVVSALKNLGSTSVVLITPYPDAINHEEIEFLGHYGCRVVLCDSFRCQHTDLTAAIASEQVEDLVLRHAKEVEMADAVFISCTQLLTMDRIDSLEQKLGRPVVTSNHATLWLALRHIGVTRARSPCGQLFTAGALPAEEHLWTGAAAKPQHAGSQLGSV